MSESKCSTLYLFRYTLLYLVPFSLAAGNQQQQKLMLRKLREQQEQQRAASVRERQLGEKRVQLEGILVRRKPSTTEATAKQARTIEASSTRLEEDPCVEFLKIEIQRLNDVARVSKEAEMHRVQLDRTASEEASNQQLCYARQLDRMHENERVLKTQVVDAESRVAAANAEVRIEQAQRMTDLQAMAKAHG